MNKNFRSKAFYRGFTLVELLVVIAIIGILVGMLFPGLQAVRESARLSQCQMRLQSLHLALSEYHVSQGAWPPGSRNPTGPIESKAQGFHHNWIVTLLPYMDRAVIAKKIDVRLGIYEGVNDELRKELLPELRCPSSAMMVPGATNYVGSHHHVEAPIDEGNLGAFILNRGMQPETDFVDGMMSTLAIGEKLELSDDLGWASGTRASLRNVGSPFDTAYVQSRPIPVMKPLDVGGFGSAHPGGVVLVMADGSYRVYDRQCDSVLLGQLANRQDGMEKANQ